jgi:hypothetical protein
MAAEVPFLSVAVHWLFRMEQCLDKGFQWSFVVQSWGSIVDANDWGVLAVRTADERTEDAFVIPL